MKILITGTRESGKDAILDLVLEGSRKLLPRFEYSRFHDIMKKSLPKERDVIRKATSFDNFNAKQISDIKSNFEKNAIAEFTRLAKSQNLIISGYFTIRAKQGYIPLISEKFFKKFSPDVIINLEMRAPDKPKPKDMPEIAGILKHQETNRIMAVSLATLTGTTVKTIKVRHGNIKYALKELSKTLEYHLGR
ncbi:MAG: AAA family ATPase [Candidatus Aenigmatarchaeota archaeon]